MSVQFLTSLSEEEFKNFLKNALAEILNEQALPANINTTDILDSKQAADFLRLKISTIYEKTSQKTIPHFKKGNKVYFNKSELQAWLEKGKVKTSDELQVEAATYTLCNQKFNQ